MNVLNTKCEIRNDLKSYLKGMGIEVRNKRIEDSFINSLAKVLHTSPIDIEEALSTLKRESDDVARIFYNVNLN